MIFQFIPYWGDEEKKAVADVLETDFLNEHKTVREFEKQFAEFVGAKHCVTVTSGTIALYLALCTKIDKIKDWNIPNHDGIFSYNACLGVKGNPTLCDVNKHGVMETIENSVIVQANGRVVENGTIEDCSQAIDYHGKDMISTYSFASTKHITTAGQGGAICCDDDETFDMLSRLKDHGRNDRQNLKPMSDTFDRWGMNFKFTEIQAGFGLAQLKKLPDRIKRFSEIYHIYKDVIGDKVLWDSVEPKWYVDVFVKNPDKIKAHLQSKNIASRKFPKPLSLQPCCGVSEDSKFPISMARYKTGLYLPSTTNLTDEEVKTIAEAVVEAVGL